MKNLTKEEFRERLLADIKKRQRKKKEQQLIQKQYFRDSIYKAKKRANKR